MSACADGAAHVTCGPSGVCILCGASLSVAPVERAERAERAERVRWSPERRARFLFNLLLPLVVLGVGIPTTVLLLALILELLLDLPRPML